MIMEGFRLMAVGMFTVFAFLTLLVGVMKASAVFFEKYSEEEPDTPAAGRAGNDGEIALALAVAESVRRGQRV